MSKTRNLFLTEIFKRMGETYSEFNPETDPIEFDLDEEDFDDEETPALNPGGGPFNPADNY